MRVGLTYDLPSDYGYSDDNLIYADFCLPSEIDYMEEAINRIGFCAVPIGNMYKLNEMLKNGTFDCDIVLVCDEGISSRNRESIVPALLELNNIPYIGGDAYCVGLAQNKYHTKLIAKELGIRFPNGIYLEYNKNGNPGKEYILNQLKNRGLSFPLIVKPNNEGCSMGVSIVRSNEELFHAVESDFDNYKEPVLIEEYIAGKELYVPMIGTGEDAYALPAGEVVAVDGSELKLYSVEHKSREGLTRYVKAELDKSVEIKMQKSALLLYRHMECRDFGRCDFRLDENGEPVMIEITPRPGLTEGGPFESSAKAVSKSYDDILKEIIFSGIKRYSGKGLLK